MRKITPVIIWNSKTRELINAMFRTCNGNILDFTPVLYRKYESMHDMIKTVLQVAYYNNFRVNKCKSFSGTIFDIPVYDTANNTFCKYIVEAINNDNTNTQAARIDCKEHASIHTQLRIDKN